MKRNAHPLRNRFAVLLGSMLLTAGCTQSLVDEPDPAPITPNQTPVESADAEIDRWMFDYLTSHYLWNHAVQATTPDYSLGYEEFLDDVLLQVAAQNDINHDDGHWENNRRSYFYSYISRTRAGLISHTPATRSSLREQTAGYGFEQLFYSELTQNRYAFVVGAVHPDGPAARAGLKRGDLISQVDGTRITAANIDRLGNKLLADETGSTTLTLYDYNTGDETQTRTIEAAVYDDNPILLRKVIQTASGRKVGYLFYTSFNLYYDEALIAAFEAFRDEAIDELILDLRYNGGGHVVSSTVLGTLIAGAPHRGEIYGQLTFNEDRKDERSIYWIGQAQFGDSADESYEPIVTALASAVELSRIYVLTTRSTASASEQVINGLRGLDIDVRLIGSQTNGKNVGMEQIVKQFGQYEYTFSPITFFIANARGERDYSNGFAPDVPATDYLWYRTAEQGPVYAIELGDEQYDELIACALEWIETGEKPDTATTRAAEQPVCGALHPLAGERPNRPQYLLVPAR